MAMIGNVALLQWVVGILSQSSGAIVITSTAWQCTSSMYSAIKNVHIVCTDAPRQYRTQPMKTIAGMIGTRSFDRKSICDTAQHKTAEARVFDYGTFSFYCQCLASFVCSLSLSFTLSASQLACIALQFVVGEVLIHSGRLGTKWHVSCRTTAKLAIFITWCWLLALLYCYYFCFFLVASVVQDESLEKCEMGSCGWCLPSLSPRHRQQCDSTF